VNKKSNKFNNYSIIPVVNGLSDDSQLLLLNNIKIQNSNLCRPIKRQINKANIENFKLNLSYETWEEIFIDDEVDKIFNSFLNTYLRVFNKSFPVKKSYHNYNNKAWLTVGIRISCQHKRNLHIFCRNVKSPILNAYYKKYCRILREVIKVTKRTHYNKLIVNSNNKSKTIWNTVNNETGKHNNIHDPPPLIMNGEKCKNSQNIANAFNLYFDTMMDNQPNNADITLGTTLNKDKFFHYLSSLSIRPTKNFKQKPVTSKEIKDIIKSLKNKNSYGYDEIAMKILKLSMPFIISPLIYICNRSLSTGILSMPFIISPLIYICNRSLSTGIFPSRLKYSQIHPIYKKGEKSETTNYRPISVLTSFSKIFEKLFLIDYIHTFLITISWPLNSMDLGKILLLKQLHLIKLIIPCRH
jgi:Notch-like protein